MTLPTSRLLSVIHSVWLDELYAEGGAREVPNSTLPKPARDSTLIPLTRREIRASTDDLLRRGSIGETVADIAAVRAPSGVGDSDGALAVATVREQYAQEQAAFVAEQKAKAAERARIAQEVGLL